MHRREDDYGNNLDSHQEDFDQQWLEKEIKKGSTYHNNVQVEYELTTKHQKEAEIEQRAREIAGENDNFNGKKSNLLALIALIVICLLEILNKHDSNSLHIPQNIYEGLFIAGLILSTYYFIRELVDIFQKSQEEKARQKNKVDPPE